jgi:hypothetical protein
MVASSLLPVRASGAVVRQPQPFSAVEVECALDALSRLRGLQSSGDPEVAHAEADRILLGLISRFVPYGEEIVRGFSEVPKWYA